MMGTKDSSTVIDISRDIIVNVEEIDAFLFDKDSKELRV